jgi:Tol biopolymer transport system component
VLSPAGDQIASVGQDAQAGVWLIDLDRDVSARVLAEGGAPAWSPDGSALAYGAIGDLGVRDLYVRSLGGDPEPKLLVSTAEPKIINDWTRDGKYIVFASLNERRVDLWLLPLFGDRQPVPYLQTGANHIQAQVSPDGRWLAYASDESGQWEVYLQSFPSPGMKRIVSVGGGGEPHWSADRRQLFYMRADKTLMSVTVNLDDPANILGPSRAQFTVPVVGDTTSFRSRYVVDSKARRFLFNAIDESQQVPITVMVNWEALED